MEEDEEENQKPIYLSSVKYVCQTIYGFNYFRAALEAPKEIRESMFQQYDAAVGEGLLSKKRMARDRKALQQLRGFYGN